jgi:hypothetical protein
VHHLVLALAIQRESLALVLGFVHPTLLVTLPIVDSSEVDHLDEKIELVRKHEVMPRKELVAQSS